MKASVVPMSPFSSVAFYIFSARVVIIQWEGVVGCGDVEAIGSRQRHALAITCVQVASTSVYLYTSVY